MEARRLVRAVALYLVAQGMVVLSLVAMVTGRWWALPFTVPCAVISYEFMDRTLRGPKGQVYNAS